MDDIIARAIEASYGLCLTADTQTYSRRRQNVLKRCMPLSGSTANARFQLPGRRGRKAVAHIKEKFDVPLLIKGYSG